MACAAKNFLTSIGRRGDNARAEDSMQKGRSLKDELSQVKIDSKRNAEAAAKKHSKASAPKGPSVVQQPVAVPMATAPSEAPKAVSA